MWITIIIISLFIFLVFNNMNQVNKINSFIYKHKEIHYKDESDEEIIFQLINNYRIDNGLNYLTPDYLTDKMAKQRVDEITIEFSHKGLDDEKTELFTLGIDAVGENLAIGYLSPYTVFGEWVKSYSHRNNILNPSYNYIGIGIIIKDGIKYYCTLFSQDDQN